MKPLRSAALVVLCCAPSLWPLSLQAQDSSVIDNLKDGKTEESAAGAGASAGAGAGVDEDDFDEAEFDKNYSGPNIGVIYDERSKSGYFVVDSEDEYKEYHYLEQIRYDDLLFVLTDTLSRLTKDGYRWSSLPVLEVFTEKLPESEVAFIYEIDKKKNVVSARVQFPDFKISLTAVKARDGGHRYDASSGRDMFQLINAFAYRINEVESVLGMDNIEYTMRFFRKDEASAPQAAADAGDQAAPEVQAMPEKPAGEE
ncbi:MAG: hypothetical protein LBC72_03050 [Spirochaetaceae bacterium]|jgi:hypothetical protein|nr:hypothetical protein [Spirochaetaceae bacterium]